MGTNCKARNTAILQGRLRASANFLCGLLITAITCCCTTLQAQKNLVPNGGFEAHKSKKSKAISNAAPWKGVFTVDYYLTNLNVDTSKFKGPHGGVACVGLQFQLDYKEFLYVKLLEKLKKNTTYHFTCYFRLFSKCPNSLKHLGVVFSKVPMNLKENVDSSNSLYVYDPKGLNNNFDWFKLEGDFVARGGERYITVGNFVHKTRWDMARVRRKPLIQTAKHLAYYFVDDVSLAEKIDTIINTPMAAAPGQVPNKVDALTPVVEIASIPQLKDTVKAEPVLNEGDKIQLKSIFFESGKADLKDDSYPELDSIAHVLEKNPNTLFVVNGHTDATGNEEVNQKLSELRAKAVFDYLIERGISNDLDYKGYGSTVPIAVNDTEEGRRMNRRVEIVVLKKQ